MYRAYLIFFVCATFLIVSFQNCAPFEPLHLQTDSSNLPIDDPKKNDSEMNSINQSLFSTALSYFPGSADELPDKRIFRLTQRQLDLTVQEILPQYSQKSVSTKMPRDPLQTNYEFSEIINFNSANITPYSDWVDEVAAAVLSEPQHIINCESQGNSLNCLQNKARIFVEKAFRHTASKAVVDRYVNFFLDTLNQHEASQAKSELVSLLLHSPYFLYRLEMNTDANDFLRPAEFMQNLTYTLADVPHHSIFPEDYEIAKVTQNSENLEAAVDTSLTSDHAKKKLVAFFKSWLEIKEPEELSGFEATLPGFDEDLAKAMVNETDQFLRHHLTKLAPTLKDVTQSSESFIDETLNQIYNNNEVSNSGPVKIDSSQRMGVLTQSSFIASHSGPDDTRLVKRGVFFTRKVMCLEIGSVPGDVETELPPDNGMLTERQRIESATNNSRCLGCHTYINPFGFIQENYNPLGQWRTRDQHGLPIDTHISVDFLDQKTYSGSDPIESLRYFTDSMRFKQCFVRQLFRYYNGRRETPSDHPLLRKMFFNFAYNDNQNILKLLETMAIGSRFSRRTERGE